MDCDPDAFERSLDLKEEFEVGLGLRTLRLRILIRFLRENLMAF